MTKEIRSCAISSVYGQHDGSCEFIRYNYFDAILWALFPVLVMLCLSLLAVFFGGLKMFAPIIGMIVGLVWGAGVFRSTHRKIKIIKGHGVCGKCSKRLSFQFDVKAVSCARVCPKCGTHYSVKMDLIEV